MPAKYDYRVKIISSSSDSSKIEAVCRELGEQGFRLIAATDHGGVFALFFECVP